MSDTGYIKLHRQVLDSWVFADEKAFKTWMWLLMKANYKDRYMSVHSGRGRDTILIKRGQIVYGRIKAEEELGISGSVIYRLLGKMEADGMIEIQSNAQFSLITICNYGSYQDEENENETRSEHERNTFGQRSDNVRTTLETRSDTTKESKESKEGKESIVSHTPAPRSNAIAEHSYPKAFKEVLDYANQKGFIDEVAKRYWYKMKADKWQVVRGGMLVNIQNWYAHFDSIAGFINNDIAREDNQKKIDAARLAAVKARIPDEQKPRYWHTQTNTNEEETP